VAGSHFIQCHQLHSAIGQELGRRDRGQIPDGVPLRGIGLFIYAKKSSLGPSNIKTHTIE
jgi:hypothetical protein